jgi:hypothetical protein
LAEYAVSLREPCFARPGQAKACLEVVEFSVAGGESYSSMAKAAAARARCWRCSAACCCRSRVRSASSAPNWHGFPPGPGRRNRDDATLPAPNAMA